jgi:prevent-host-death family protein
LDRKYCVDGLDDHLHGQQYGVTMISLTDAKARLSELVDRVEAGDSVDISRRGKPVVRSTGVSGPRKQIDIALLRSSSATMAPQSEDAADLVRRMRDGDVRYTGRRKPDDSADHRRLSP